MKQYMPIDADLSKLRVYNDFGDAIYVDVPSRSDHSLVHKLKIDRVTREISCNPNTCLGFRYNGICHHIKALLFLFYIRKKKRSGMDTRLEAYYELLRHPDRLKASQYRVYKYLIDNGPADFGGIAKGLGLPDRAHVTGRIDELRNLQLVEDAGRVDKRHVWRAVS